MTSHTSHHHTNSCPHCAASLAKAPSRLLRAAVVGLAWTVSMAYVFASIMLGPAIIGVLPLLIPMGIASISSAHTWAYGDRICDSCGKLVELDGELVLAEPELASANTEPELALAA